MIERAVRRATALALFAPAIWGLLLGPAEAAPAKPLTTVQVDLDGDSRTDSVTVSSDGRIAARRADGFSEALSFNSLPQLTSTSVEVWTGRTGDRYLRVEGRLPSGGRQLLLAALVEGRLVEIHNGPVGAAGRDAEYAIEVKLIGGELQRYQTAPNIRRCDGETRLFIERYVPAQGWRPAPEAALPSLDGPALRTQKDAPPGLPAPPLGIYRYVAASAQAGIGRADLLAPPRELFDGSSATAWQLVGDGRGAFVTAQAEGSGHAVRALRIEAAPAKQGPLPRQLLLIFDDKKMRVELAASPPGGVQWLLLLEPVPSRCLSIVIAEGSSKAATALGEVAIYSEIDGAAGPKALVEKAALGNSADFDGAVRTLLLLLRRQPSLGGEIVAAVESLLKSPDTALSGRRRLEELLLQVGELLPPGEAAHKRTIELLLFGLRLLPPAERTARLATFERGGPFGRVVLGGVVLEGDDNLAAEVRAEALALLRCLPAEHPTLSGAGELLRRTLTDVAAPGQDSDAARRLKLAAALILGLSRSLAGCPDAAGRQAWVDRLTALWPATPPAGSAESSQSALFLLRYRLLQALEQLATATPQSLALLNAILEKETEPVLRQVASRALVVTAAERRSAGLSDRDAGVRLATLAALSGVMQEGAPPALIAAIEERLAGDGWPQIRRAAAEVRAAACRAPSSGVAAGPVPALRKALADSDEQVQRQALLGLGRCEGAGAADVLLKIAEDRQAVVETRGLACGMLARHTFAAPALDGGVRHRAHRAAAGVILDLLQDPAADERYAGALAQCMRGLGDAGDAADVAPLVEVASSDVPASLRQGALLAVAAICGRGVELSPSLRKSLAALFKGAAADADTKVQAAARRGQAMCK